MKKTIKYLYGTTFWVSRIFTVSIFGICLSMVLHAKYVLPEKYSYFLITIIENLEKNIDLFNDWLLGKGLEVAILPKITFQLYYPFCKNSQIIDLLLIALILISLLSILVINIFNKKYNYFLAVSFIVYVLMYVFLEQQIMLALAIITPITLIIIKILNKILPAQKITMLIPIIGEIFCTTNIFKHIVKNCSENLKNIILLIVAIILSNVICLLFPYKTERDIKNLIITNWTYSIRTYKNKTIISGDGELLIIDDIEKKYMDINIPGIEQDFIFNKNKKEMYIYNIGENTLLILDAENLSVIKKIDIGIKNNISVTRIGCNENFSKLFIVFEFLDIGCLIDLNTYNLKYIKRVSYPRDSLIYNKYRNCFLISYHDYNKFLKEIDIENKKIRKIKAEEFQGYMAVSERNKEIYIAFHQQGRIGVYDAETMKLKRKIKSNYAVKDITYDEELNILIAPSYFTGYTDIFLMDGSDKLLTREFIGYELREGCFDSQKENLYICSMKGLYKKKIDIKKLIKEHSEI